MIQAIFCTTALAVAVAVNAPASAGCVLQWNPSTDWSGLEQISVNTRRNPVGDWLCAQADSPGAVAIPMREGPQSVSDGRWKGFLKFFESASIGINRSSSPIMIPASDGGAWIEPGQIVFDGGEVRPGKTAVLRWTASCEADVRIRAEFSGGHIPVDPEDPGTVCRALVFHGADLLWQEQLSGFVGCPGHPRTGPAPGRIYSGTVRVEAGDTIDFECDFSNTPAGPLRGLTGLKADITVVRLRPPFDSGPPNGWVNALKPSGAAGRKIDVAKAGRAMCTILLPARPDTRELKAAGDLRRWLFQMTGAQLPIVRECGFETRPAGSLISIGSTRLLKAVELEMARRSLGLDGYAIFQHDGVLYLRGGTRRGPINAVYALLEEDLGCRWYDRYSATIPFRPDLNFTPVTRAFVPQLDIRDPFYWDAFDANWSIRNRTNAPWAPVPEDWGGTTTYAIFVHSLGWLMHPDRYFSEHPDYFALRNGKRVPDQPCLTNPAVLPIVVEAVRNALRNSPASRIISISYNDNGEYCQCPTCAASDEQDNPSGTLLKFANDVADAIKDEFPDVKVSALAYWGTFEPPKRTTPRDNVVVQLCTDSHAFPHPFLYVTESEKFQSAMKGWEAMGARTYIWDYNTNFTNYSLPMPNMQVCDYNFEFFFRHGASGIMTQGAYESPGGENGPMRAWVWAKKLWDPSLDSRALMRDFIFGYYREAAQPVWDYNMALWDMWERHHKMPLDDSNPITTSTWFQPDVGFLTAAFLDKAMALMNESEALARTPETRRRVALARYPVLYAVLCQEIGFVGGGQVLHLGRSWDSADKSRLKSLVNEFEQTTACEGVTRLAEARDDVHLRIARWKSILDADFGSVRVTPLDNVWRFSTDPGNVGMNDRWYAESAEDSGWSIVRSDRGFGWEKQGFENYVGLGWYRQPFTVPADHAEARHLYLVFRGVDEEGWVFINGKSAFERSSETTGKPPVALWDLPFAFDAKPYIEFGKPNVLAVRVNNVGAMGGIWRPVYLVASDTEFADVHMLAAAISAKTRK